MAAIQDNSPSKVYSHSNALIGDEVLVWGGRKPGLPFVHDSPEKRQFTSSVDVYNVLNRSYVERPTTGTPHTGTMSYSCCSVGSDIYYFGGQCINPCGCYHNNLSVLDTNSNKWRETVCDDGPMKKSGCGMIPFSSDGQNYLLVIGGIGPRPVNTPAHSQYTPYPNKPSLYYTNEIHIMCISATPGKWTVPNRSGSVFPASAGFSIDVVPGSNTAIIYGGGCVKDQKRTRTSDIFIMSYSKNTVNILNPSDPYVRWPEARSFHSSAIISGTVSNGVLKHYLLVLGGVRDNDSITDDFWIMNIESKTWEKIILPQSVVNKKYYSMTSYKMSTNCVWLLITGGRDSKDFIANPDILNVIELVFSPTDNQWMVTSVMNETDMSDEVGYTKRVLDCLSVFRRESQMMEREVPKGPMTGGGGEGQVQLLVEQQLKRKDEEISELMADMQLKHRRELSRQEEAHHQQQHQLHHQIREQEEIMRRNEATIREKDETIQQKFDTNRQNQETIRKTNDTLLQQTTTIRQKCDEIKQNRSIVRQKEVALQQKKATIAEKEDIIQQYRDTIGEKEAALQQKDAEIVDLHNQLESRPWILQEEEVQITEEKIGGGAYGEVRVAVFRGTRVAAKCLHEIIVSRHNRDIFTREMDISSKIHHPNIVQFLGATRVDNPILLYELMTTSLYKRLQEDESLTCPQISTICCDIASALCYLHQWKPDPIIHRDISSPNVLMEPANNRWRAKVSDFGSANLQLHVKTVVPGNPAYAAPEAKFPEDHSPAMDVYSFGILVTEMSLHSAPELDSRRREGRARRMEWVAMKVIVLNCIKNDHSQRLTSTQLLRELKRL